ncbi:MAG: protein adenylyltransferase SelO family protein, partial [Pseudomonadales bacterium]|nr:protein adenylyltransferase SelO family protein [Pseudomonadales bacterium]
MPIQFDNSYARLPDRFFARQMPEPASKPELIRVNRPLAELLGIDADWLASDEGVSMVAGNALPAGSDPIATVYGGHQFGTWNPQLGDGRAVLLGEIVGGDSQRYDIQLKGSGQTPYSRMGDGRAPLGPVLREYVISEAMAVLGVPTSRSLAAVTTGDPVYRETALPGAVLARVARSHIRIGTIQFFAAQEDVEALRLLVEHVVERHYPDISDDCSPGLSLLDKVIQAQA